MKKLFLVTIMMGCIIGLLTACGGDEASGSDEGGKTLSFGHGSAETNVRHEAVKKFKEIVESETDGEITIEIFPNETIGSEPEMIENVSLGDLDMALAGAGIFTQYDPLMGATALPYLFDGYEHAWEVLDGEIGDVIAEPLLEDNLRILSYFENGMRQITNSAHPIETPEDLEGLTIRTPESEVSIDALDAMGASSTPMAFGELYLALQQGTVDGQENPLANIHASKFDEVQEYVSMTGHQYSTLPLAINEELWQSLSEEHKEAIQTAAGEASDFHRETVKSKDEELLQELEDAGMKVNTPDKAPFKEAVQSVHDKYSETYGQEFMDQLMEAIEEAR